MKTRNKDILDTLIKGFPRVKKMTYIELGIFLEKIFPYQLDWVSLGEAHDYLGGYKNEKRDNKIKKEILGMEKDWSMNMTGDKFKIPKMRE